MTLYLLEYIEGMSTSEVFYNYRDAKNRKSVLESEEKETHYNTRIKKLEFKADKKGIAAIIEDVANTVSR